MSTLPILYSFRRCPYAMRARMALIASGIVCAIREVRLADKPAALVEASRKATVPVLVLPDDRVIDQSLDIMRWALCQNDPEDWLGGDDATLVAANDEAFKHHLDHYKYPDRHGADPALYRAAGLAWLETLDAQLARRANLCRESRTLTDIAIFPFVRQFAQVDREWFNAQPLSALRAWLQRHLDSPLFSQAMIQLSQWRPDDAVTRFPG